METILPTGARRIQTAQIAATGLVVGSVLVAGLDPGAWQPMLCTALIAATGLAALRAGHQHLGSIATVAACASVPVTGLAGVLPGMNAFTEGALMVAGLMLAGLCLPLRLFVPMVAALIVLHTSLVVINPHIPPAAAVTTASTLAVLAVLAGALAHTIDTHAATLAGLRAQAVAQAQHLAEANAALTEAQKKLVRAEKLAAIGQLSAAIAHEINNPMTTILTSGVLLSEDLQGQEAALASKIVTAAKRCRGVTRALLQIGQPGAGEAELLDLAELASHAAALSRSHLASSGSQLALRTAGPVLVWGDQEQLGQALLNLIDNAARALQGRAGRIQLSAGQDGARAWVRIRDDGAGIPEDVQARMFEPFFSTRADGSGLGLSLVQRVAADHDGEVVVESAPGSGSTFTLWLPLAAQRAAEVS